MKKMTTLFKKDPNDLGRVINEIDPDNQWATEVGLPTRKFDGTACAIINGELYKRFDLKKGRKLPDGKSVQCQEPDAITGHHPHWIECFKSDPSNKYHFEAFHGMIGRENGTYELCGPKVQGNPEDLKNHTLIKHGAWIVPIEDFSYEGIKKALDSLDIEGIVFHNIDGRMCKIRKSDFGIIR